MLVLSDDQLRQARLQLGLRADMRLLGATRFLEHDSGDRVVRIPLPGRQVVAAFEGQDGRRVYGVVTFDTLSYQLNAL